MSAQDKIDAAANSTQLAKRGLLNELYAPARLATVARALPLVGLSEEERQGVASRMVQVAYTAANKNPALMRCTPASIIASVVEAAQLGLSVDGVLGHSYLVPYSGRATLQVGYRGMIHMAYKSGSVERITADVVYEGDMFDYQEGTGAFLHHRRPLDAEEDGRTIGAFALCRLKGASSDLFRVLPLRQIERHRKRSKSGNTGPWKTDYDAMAMKTAIRMLAKLLPAESLQRVAAGDEQREQGIRASLVSPEQAIGAEEESDAENCVQGS